jgi:hypothetical protein
MIFCRPVHHPRRDHTAEIKVNCLDYQENVKSLKYDIAAIELAMDDS